MTQEIGRGPEVARRLTALLWASLLACGSGEGDKGPQVTVTPGAASFEMVHVQWTAAGPAPERYIIEVRVPPGAYWNAADVPGTALAADVLVPVELLAEVTDAELRVRPSVGKPSAPAAFHRGLRPPEDLQLWFSGPPFELRWMNRSVLSTALVVERRRVLCGTAGEWRTVATLPVPGAFVDTSIEDWTDGAVLEYRIHSEWVSPSTMQTVRSATVGPVATRWADLATPTLVSVEPQVGGARLRFANQSVCATALVVQREAMRSGTAEAVATLPSTAVEYVDRAAAPGRYSYRLSARRVYGLGNVNGSALASRTGLVGPPASWGMALSAVSLPPGLALARTASGAWASASRLGGFPFDAPVFIAPAGVERVLQPAGGSEAFAPGIALDPSGMLHAVFAGTADPDTGVSPIVHAWFDGAAWQTEEIARRAFSGADGTQVIRLAVGLDGTLHASWQAGPDPALGLEVASLRAAGWEIVSLATVLGASAHVRWKDHAIAAGDAGGPHLIVSDWDGTLRHIWKGAGGWILEPVPEVTCYGGFQAVGGAGWVALAYLDLGPDDTRYTVKQVTWRAEGWTTPEALGQVGRAVVGGLQVARSADGARFAVGANRVDDVDGGRVWVRGDGAARELRFFDLPSAFAVGFEPDGRVWLATGALEYATGTTLQDVDGALFEEP